MICCGKFTEYKNPDVLKQYYLLTDVPVIRARHDVIGKYLDPVAREICLVSWVVLLAGVVYFLVMRRSVNLTRPQKYMMLFMAGFSLLYLAFSAVAHPIHLRYLLPVQPLQLCLLYFMLNAVKKQPKVMETEPVVMQVVK